MPDGSARPPLIRDPFSTQPVEPEWSQMSGLTADGDLVALQAAARFAELAVEVAINEALAEVQPSNPAKTRDPADPLDQVAADWAAKTDADEQIIHAFLGIDDPIGREADTVFVDAQVDATLEAFLDQLPDTVLQNGELAALNAFDIALTSGSDAAEALSAAIEAAEQVGASAATASALANSPSGIGLGLGTASLTEPEAEPPEDTRTSLPAPEPAPFISSIPSGALAAFSFGVSVSRDDAFGFGFQFSTEPVEPYTPASNRRVEERAIIDTEPDNTVSYTSIIGTAATDLLVGSAGQDALAGKEAGDYVYADLPTNYDASVHDSSNPLTNPTFAASGGDDIASGGAGDDFLWGGAGDDQLHGDVPDTSTALFTEFAFGLGATTSGDDTLYGGEGDDSLWGGGGADVLFGEDGNDYLSGDAGADQLYGGAGGDNIFGYAGDDIIQGGEGNDTVAGGDGADTFEFAGGSGASVTERVQSLGVDTISDYTAADADVFALSDADFGLGNTGVLTDNSNYFEIADGTLSNSPFDISGGSSGAAILVMGSNSGSNGVNVYYTEDAAAATNLNSYQIADIISVNASDFEAADFLLKS